MRNNQKAGLSSTYYAVKGLPVYDSVLSIVQLGYGLIELGAAHSYEKDIWDTLNKIKSDFSDSKFTIHCLFPPRKEKIWFNPADGLSDINGEIVDDLFKAADILGASLISIHPPVLDKIILCGNKVPGGFLADETDGSMNEEKCRTGFAEFMDYICVKAEKSGIFVGIENMDDKHFNVMLKTAEDFSSVFAKYPKTGLVLDVAHAKLSGNLDELKKLGNNILEVHLHETRLFPNNKEYGHFIIRDTGYFEDIRGLLFDSDIPAVFEHGDSVSEEDILKEKELLENFMTIDMGAARS